MPRLYRLILSLYPAEYRTAFAAEMIKVFDQASGDARNRGTLKSMLFAVSELGGLVKGLVSEHAAKWRDGAAYVTSRCVP